MRYVRLTCLLLLAGAAFSGAAALPPAPPFMLAETSLGKAGDFDALKNVVISPDGEHLAFLGVKGGKQVVVRDGIPGPLFDWVVPDSLLFSPNSDHLSYVVQTSLDTIAVIDSKPMSRCYAIEHERVALSENGRRYAYIAKLKQGGARLVTEAGEGPLYDAVDFPEFSPDGAHLAYRAQRAGKQFAVLDGKEQSPCDSLPDASFIFSPDSKRLAYEAVRGAKHFAVVGDQESAPFDALRLGPGFNADGSHWLAVVDVAGRTSVVLDGVASAGYDAIIAGDLAFSPNGQHLAYGVKRGDKQMIVLDGVEQMPFDELGNAALRFSPDSRRLAYQARSGGNGFMVIDGKKQKVYDGFLRGSPVFSPDSRRVAYGAQRRGKWLAVIDGKEEREWDTIDVPLFSPDSLHCAYRTISGQQAAVVRDGVASAAYEAAGSVAFSPDSRHLIHIIKQAGHTDICVDGRPAGRSYDPRVPGTRPVFDDDHWATLMLIRTDEFLRVRVKMPE